MAKHICIECRESVSFLGVLLALIYYALLALSRTSPLAACVYTHLADLFAQKQNVKRTKSTTNNNQMANGNKPNLGIWDTQ